MFCTFLTGFLHQRLRLMHRTQFRRGISGCSVALAATCSSVSTVSVVTPRMDLICSLVSTRHTSLKRTERLLALSSWLVHSWKLSKTLFMVSACYETTLKLIKLSSANNKFEILGMFLAILMGVCLFSIISFLERWTSPSAMNMERYGLRGSPCQTAGWVERF